MKKQLLMQIIGCPVYVEVKDSNEKPTNIAVKDSDKKEIPIAAK